MGYVANIPLLDAGSSFKRFFGVAETAELLFTREFVFECY
jgi:hypothetical protein